MQIRQKLKANGVYEGYILAYRWRREIFLWGDMFFGPNYRPLSFYVVIFL
jgi:hypothetical protein